MNHCRETHFDNVNNIHAILSVEKLPQKAEATVHINGADLFSAAEDENMYAAIDALTDKLDRQIIKHKEKRSDHHRGSSSALQASLDAEPAELEPTGE